MTQPDVYDWRNIRGLTQEEVAARLQRDGPNELPVQRGRSITAIAAGVVREPIFLLLVAADSLYFVLGELGDAFILLCFVLVVMAITIYQEWRTERTLEALRDLTSPRVLVVRNGQQQRIPGREVVQGDVLVLAEGDRVPADAAVLAQRAIQLDESLLTGEALPVGKTIWNGMDAAARPGSDSRSFVYSGTLVVQGAAIAEVLATGSRSEIGRIGTTLRDIDQESTPLQKQTRRLVRTLAVIGIALCFLLVAVYGLTRHDWITGLLAGITLAMATLPEEFPVVLTVFLAIGAWRISRQRVLTRRIPAVEALGSATVLCVDKTGTLTENRMAVHTLVSGQSWFHVFEPKNVGELPEAFHELLEFGILASAVDPFDPMEKAMRALGERYLARTEHIHEDWELVHAYPLTRAMRALSHVWRSTKGADYVVATKGAPEAIADLCHLEPRAAALQAEQVEQLSGKGLRVLGVAAARFKGAEWPPAQHDFDFHPLGLIALADPLRPAVPAAIAECRNAGIRVVMITGDHPGTALAIARDAGLDSGEIMTGPELDRLSEPDLCLQLSQVSVFARVVPDQKLKIVQALKANGEVVAMTGDGVNDAPALKAAHIGIAMGGRGTDVAREASSLVLLDDDFASIVSAVRLGRRIYDNLRKSMAYILAIHVPIAGLSLLPVLFGWPPAFFPVHIAFLQLIIDPGCSIVFEAEPEESDIMRRPPRPRGEPLFGGRTLGISLLQGLGVLVFSAVLYATALHRGLREDTARSLAFVMLVSANLALMFVNRSRNKTLFASLRVPNRALWLVSVAAASCLILVLQVPALRAVFHFAALNADAFTVAVVTGFGSAVWFEGFKAVRNLRHSK